MLRLSRDQVVFYMVQGSLGIEGVGCWVWGVYVAFQGLRCIWVSLNSKPQTQGLEEGL